MQEPAQANVSQRSNEELLRIHCGNLHVIMHGKVRKRSSQTNQQENNKERRKLLTRFATDCDESCNLFGCTARGR